jgi:hypothetical protein
MINPSNGRDFGENMPIGATYEKSVNNKGYSQYWLLMTMNKDGIINVQEFSNKADFIKSWNENSPIKREE